MEYFRDAKCFVYDTATDSVEYKKDYDTHIPKERMMPDNEYAFDAELMTSLTTWLPGKITPEPDFAGYREHVVPPDRIDYIMSTIYWKGIST